jgi:DNA-binding Lrp family transcriptional regulator|tara:strand:- start:713 stop:952 length:240 start_codon:yes stop_codon:yes gene_type:complete
LATAYVLINCELGAEEAVISELKPIEGVVEVHGTFGAYDILAKVELSLVEALRETITWKIRKIAKIRSTLTLMGIDGQQ